MCRSIGMRMFSNCKILNANLSETRARAQHVSELFRVIWQFLCILRTVYIFTVILRQQRDCTGWVGLEKWQVLLTFSTIYADVGWVCGWVTKSPKMCWRNIGMVHIWFRKLICIFLNFTNKWKKATTSHMICLFSWKIFKMSTHLDHRKPVINTKILPRLTLELELSAKTLRYNFWSNHKVNHVQLAWNSIFFNLQVERNEYVTSKKVLSLEWSTETQSPKIWISRQNSWHLAMLKFFVKSHSPFLSKLPFTNIYFFQSTSRMECVFDKQEGIVSWNETQKCYVPRLTQKFELPTKTLVKSQSPFVHSATYLTDFVFQSTGRTECVWQARRFCLLEWNTERLPRLF